MEQILPNISAIPNYSISILITLPLPDLVNLCKTSKELEELICQESFWEKKAKHDHSFLNNTDRPPTNFETWREYLIHRYSLRKTIKDLFYRWQNLSIITEEEEEDDEDRDNLSPTLYFGNQDPGFINDRFLNLLRVKDEIRVLYQDSDGLVSGEYDDEELEEEMPEFFRILDSFDLKILTLSSRGKVLFKLKC